MNLDWAGCKEQRVAKAVTVDFNRTNSLVKLAENKEKTSKKLQLDEISKETIVSLKYDILRELLEALALKQGYKIYNHECYTCFLRSIIKDESFAIEFDSLRQLRNSINYYGETIVLNDAKEIIKSIEILISKTRKLLRIK